MLFGATGDLAKRMVLPAFYQLATEGLLPKQWRLVGNGRGDVAHEDFRAHVREALTEFGPKPEPKDWDAFAERVFFAGGGFDTDNPGSLLDVLGKARTSLGADPQLVHYLAVPPVAFGELTKALGQHGLAKGARVVYEKPFGTSRRISASWTTSSIRSWTSSRCTGSTISWARKALRICTCCVSPTGPRPRSGTASTSSRCRSTCPRHSASGTGREFYDATGAVLDMLVTHLFQVAAEVAMEPPASLGPLDLQAARETVISHFRPLDPAEVVLGQFDGYRDVPGIDPHSSRDTFVAARLWIDTDRWRDVPFYLRTGKRLHASRQRVSLILREPAGPLAGQLPPEANVLSFSLAGDGEIDLSLVAKKPGPALDLDVAHASIPLASLPGADPLPPYVRLIHDVLLGDRSLFTRPDGLAAVWDVAEPLLSRPPQVSSYAPGSWGPVQARDLVAPGRWLLGQ